MTTKSVLKSKREWLEQAELSGSYYNLVVGKDTYNKDEAALTLADCDRKITWYFGKPGEKRGKRKIAKLKKLVDSLYNYLHKTEG